MSKNYILLLKKNAKQIPKKKVELKNSNKPKSEQNVVYVTFWYLRKMGFKIET